MERRQIGASTPGAALTFQGLTQVPDRWRCGANSGKASTMATGQIPRATESRSASRRDRFTNEG